MTLHIRTAYSESDFKAAFALVQALAAHENSLEHLKIEEAEFLAAAAGSKPLLRILLAFKGKTAVGVATYVERFHIWNGGHIFELDDLFVNPKERGGGIGSKLLKELGAMAKAKDSPVKWQVDAKNVRAISLYKRLGADYRTSGICFWRPEKI